MPKLFLITSPFQGELGTESCPDPREGELLCRPLCIGLCGTDRLVFAGEMPAAVFPRIPCHEVVGFVLKDNSKLGLREGTAVVVDPYKNCGNCHACKNGRSNCCRFNKTLGVQRDGILRECFVVEADRVHIVPIEADVRRFALAEPLTLALHVADRAGDVKGRWCLVAGVGNVGSMVVRVLKEHGARIIAWSISDISLCTASKLGAELCIKASDPDAESQVLEATRGEGVSVAIECAGKSSVVETCVRLAAFAGRVVLVGHSKQVSGIKGSDIVFKELDVLGSRNSHGRFETAISWLANDADKWNSVISHRYRWPDALSAFKLTTSAKGQYSKIVIDF